jgi:serine protease
MKEEVCPASYQEAINGIIEQGVLVVVAAGNDELGDDDQYVVHRNARAYSPANCLGVLRVIATDYTGELAPYSRVDLSPDDIDITIAALGGYMGEHGELEENGILSTVDKGTTTPEGFDYD